MNIVKLRLFFILFTIASRFKKKNYKAYLKQILKDLTKWKDIFPHGFEDLALFNGSVPQTGIQSQCNSHQNPSWPFCRN